MGHVAAVRCVQYDGHKVVSGAYDYTVKVWDPESESCTHTLQGHTNRVYSLQVRAWPLPLTAGTRACLFWHIKGRLPSACMRCRGAQTMLCIRCSLPFCPDPSRVCTVGTHKPRFSGGKALPRHVLGHRVLPEHHGMSQSLVLHCHELDLVILLVPSKSGYSMITGGLWFARCSPQPHVHLGIVASCSKQDSLNMKAADPGLQALCRELEVRG